MKKLRQIIAEVKSLTTNGKPVHHDLLWQLICYPPKMPLRLQQQQLLDEAEQYSLQVPDPEFSKTALSFNIFKWGTGKRKVLLSHGWGSKAADFAELISALRKLNDIAVIAFDAPGNGSAEGGLSNLLLYIRAIEKVISHEGDPDILIGHSLGAMANMIVLKETGISPSLLLSITPLIRLKENFEHTMLSAGLDQDAQNNFFLIFEQCFGMQASAFNMNSSYVSPPQVKHWLAYDHDDHISPYAYIEEFLTAHPQVTGQAYPGAGHEKILKTPQVIQDILGLL